MNIKDLKDVYGIVYAFKAGDDVNDIAYVLKVKNSFVQEIIRQWMNGEIK